MNFDCRISSLEEQSRTISQDIKKCREAFTKATEFTTKFLAECQAAGITKVAIGTCHKSIPCSTDWPFDHSGSVFAFQPKSVRDKVTWPPIWGVVERLGISRGCGNSNQHEADLTNLIDGVYHLKAGNWAKVG